MGPLQVMLSVEMGGKGRCSHIHGTVEPPYYRTADDQTIVTCSDPEVSMDSSSDAPGTLRVLVCIEAMKLQGAPRGKMSTG